MGSIRGPFLYLYLAISALAKR